MTELQATVVTEWLKYKRLLSECARPPLTRAIIVKCHEVCYIKEGITQYEAMVVWHYT